MSFALHGLPVSSGIAIGHAHLVSHTSLEVAHYVLPKQLVAEEVVRLDDALETTRKELAELRGSARNRRRRNSTPSSTCT